MKRAELTQERLKELIQYHPLTGEFSWYVQPKGRPSKDGKPGTTTLGYRIIFIDGHRYQAHRLAFLYMTGSFPVDQVDHINGIRDDNRWLNLRDSYDAENAKNKCMLSNNTSGITGVHYDSRKCRWQARVKLNRAYIWLGSFADKFEAACARKSAEIRYGFSNRHGQPINSFQNAEIIE